jgi:hypothetical protein
MTKQEETIILGALEKCRERIERSFDYFIDEMKSMQLENAPDMGDMINDNLNER